ncbi:hypothetical protein KBD75_04060 [Candidatus Woesebacteria bacterium]|nr:hypothetical protein [Candidatus Woesebacteria bacterium]
MNPEAIKVLQDVARKRIGETTTKELPIQPIDLSDVVLLTMCEGDRNLIIQTIVTIATTEFDLIKTEKGIDLPPSTKLSEDTRLKVLYKDPIYYAGIPDMPINRVSRHGKVDPHKGQE